MREAAIVAAIVREFRHAGGFVEKTHGNDYTRIGMPDLVGCFRGRYIAIEVKAPGKKATPAQLRVLEEIRAAGGLAYVMDSVDEVRQLIEELSHDGGGVSV